jgi:thiol-disulfide isomerase/thioredoxin
MINLIKLSPYLFLIIPFLSYSQEKKVDLREEQSITIELKPYDRQDSHGFLIVYPISHMADSLRNQLQFPDLSKSRDTAFAEIYFTGNNEGALTNTVMTVISNYNSSSPKLWIDYDNDLDLSESKEALQFEEDSIEVSISDKEKTSLHHSIRFYKPDSAKYHRTDSMLTKHITKGKHVDFYYDQRLNIQVGNFIYDGDSMRIGVMDYNVNGAYDDLYIDRIVFGAYNGEIDGTDKANGAIVLDKANFFKNDNQGFKIDHIEPNGTKISISPIDDLKVKDRIKVGDAISDYTFELVNGKATSIQDLLDGENYLYLNFWASWCAGCHQEMKSLQKAASSDSIKVVSLNYNEEHEVIDQFIEKYQPSWLQGRSTDKINLELMIEGLPRNILIDPNGIIIEMNIRPNKLLK